MHRIVITLLLLLTIFNTAVSQETFHANGVADETEIVHAFTNAKIYLDYKTILESGTLVIKDQLIIWAIISLHWHSKLQNKVFCPVL